MLLGILKKRMKSSFIGIYKGKWKYENLGRGLRYLISSIKPSFFECSHDVNSYLISIAYSPCACKKNSVIYMGKFF